MTQTQSKPVPHSARIEVFRTGTFRPLKGAEIAYSAADLRAIADAYDPDTAPAPIVVGHPTTDAPAFGWIEKLTYDVQADRLVADLHEIQPEFAAAVKEGRYKKVSMAFFRPDHPANPVPGTWYPKHLGFLGGTPPAVTGLKNAAFSAEPEASVTFTAEFGDRTAEAAAGLLRSLRDFLIEKFGLDEADKALPGWNIEWLSETGDAPVPAYSAPTDPTPQKPENIVPNTPDPAFASREAALQTREAQIAAREAEIAHADNVSFAEGLVTEGKLIPASRDNLVGLLDGLRGSTATVSFAGGDDIDPATAIRQLLEAQPKVVTFGSTEDPGAPASQGAAEFAADGRQVDPTGLALHQKALDYQRQHPGTEYLAAVRAVS